MTSTGSSSAPSRRKIRIDVVDALSRPLLGASLHIFIERRRVATARDFPGKAHICLPPDDRRDVDVHLTLPDGSFHSSALVSFGTARHKFRVGAVFPPPGPTRLAEAECANGGKVGQPCVECEIDGDTIEICAH